MDLLPPDILYKIVLPLPIKCLVRFRCACKRFYADPIIADRVEKLFEEPNILLVTSFPGSDVKPRYEEDAAGFLKVSIPQAKVRPSLSHPALLGSCDGLMMFEGDPGVCFLVNPLREEALIPWSEPPFKCFDSDIQGRLIYSSLLARPGGGDRGHDWLERSLTFSSTEEYWCASGLGLDHVTGEYKFVLVSMSIRTTMVNVLGTGSWWRIRNPNPSSRPSGRGIFIDGTLYWPRSPPMDGGLVTFDVAEEEYDYISCLTSSGVMVELRNRLGVADISPEGLVDIWELDIQTKGWVKKYEVDFLRLANLSCRPPRLLERHSVDVLGMWNQKIVFKCESTLYSYDPQISRSIEPVRYPRLDSRTMLYCIRGGPVSPYRFKPLTPVYEYFHRHVFCFSYLKLI